MPKGSLIYSAEACDALPLFYRKQFKLLQGGAEGKLYGGPLCQDTILAQDRK